MVSDEPRATMVRELRAAGWTLIRSDGKHDVYGCPCGAHIAPLPRHRTISPGVVASIRRVIRRCQEGR